MPPPAAAAATAAAASDEAMGDRKDCSAGVTAVAAAAVDEEASRFTRAVEVEAGLSLRDEDDDEGAVRAGGRAAAAVGDACGDAMESEDALGAGDAAAECPVALRGATGDVAATTGVSRPARAEGAAAAAAASVTALMSVARRFTPERRAADTGTAAAGVAGTGDGAGDAAGLDAADSSASTGLTSAAPVAAGAGDGLRVRWPRVLRRPAAALAPVISSAPALLLAGESALGRLFGVAAAVAAFSAACFAWNAARAASKPALSSRLPRRRAPSQLGSEDEADSAPSSPAAAAVVPSPPLPALPAGAHCTRYCFLRP